MAGNARHWWDVFGTLPPSTDQEVQEENTGTQLAFSKLPPLCFCVVCACVCRSMGRGCSHPCGKEYRQEVGVVCLPLHLFTLVFKTEKLTEHRAHQLSMLSSCLCCPVYAMSLGTYLSLPSIMGMRHLFALVLRIQTQVLKLLGRPFIHWINWWVSSVCERRVLITSLKANASGV